MAMQVGGKKGEAIAAINVTPMADIMIVLLIIFMVTPMLQKGVEVKLPEAGNTKDRKEEEKTIIVAIRNDATKSTFLGGTQFQDPALLVKEIKSRLEELPDGSKMIYLKADESLEYSEVMKVMNLVREAGVEEISLIAEKKVSS